MSKSSNLGEQALSKAAEVGLQSQLDQVDKLEVEIHTDPGKMMQGELESVEINGDGLVMEKDLRAQELDIEIDSIAIDPLKAAFGEIKLTHPTNATAHVVLTQKDIERAFNSEYIQEKLEDLEIEIDGQSTPIQTNYIHFEIPAKDKVALKAEVTPIQGGETQTISFCAVPQVVEGGNCIELKDIEYLNSRDADTSAELTFALLDSAKDLLDLRNFELKGMSLRLEQLSVQNGQLTLKAETRVEQFPS